MRIFLAILIIVLGSCSPQIEADQPNNYFDLEDYLEGLAQDDLRQKSVTKTVSLNGEQEIQTLSDYDISPELNMMKKYNINKPALSGKYVEKTEGNKTIYSAKEESLITQTLTLEKNNNVVSLIEIEGLQKSILSESKQTIIFAPGKSFLLKSEDNNRYTSNITKEVLIEY